MNTQLKNYLEKTFGNRVTFRLTERKLYGHDIAAVPGVMDNLMPHMIGDVVPLITRPMIDYLRKGK